MTKFPHRLVVMEDGEIKEIGTAIIYNTDGETTLSDWVKPKDDSKKIPALPLKSALKIGDSKSILVKNMDANSFGYLNNNANNVCSNGQYVGIYSSAFASGHGCEIRKENFLRVCCAFAARRLIQNNWVNHASEYFAPNEFHPDFREYELDSVILSLFENKSNQSSLRNISYDGKKWNVVNQFFFMGRDDIMALADKYNNDECFNDANGDSDRFVYKFIQEHKKEFSQESKAVLDKAIELIEKSFPFRDGYNRDVPTCQINNWDAGWYQVKAMLDSRMPNDLKEFKKLYSALSDKMRPMVKKLGFILELGESI